MPRLKHLAQFGIMFISILLIYGCVTEGAYRGPEIAPLRPGDLRGLRLEMVPDPVREAQKLGFYLLVLNRSSYSGRISLFIKDRDQVIAEAYNVLVQPGENRVDLPWTGYRFSRVDHCFAVEVEIEGNRRPLDIVKQFCARKTDRGWTLADLHPAPPPPPAPPVPHPAPPSIGPFFVEDLEMRPDPVRQKQQIQFRVKLRNDGKPVRANLRIQDRNEIVVQIDNILLRRGMSEYEFPYTGYAFQRLDHCFTVVVDVEKSHYTVEAKRKFCARHITRPPGWTLQP